MLSLEPKKHFWQKTPQLSTLHRNFISTKKRATYLFQPKKPTCRFVSGSFHQPTGFPVTPFQGLRIPWCPKVDGCNGCWGRWSSKRWPPKKTYGGLRRNRGNHSVYQGCDLFWWFSCLLVLARNGCWYLFWGERMLKQPSLSPDCYTMYHCVTAYHVISL